jgi:hypothetical protein
MALVTLLPRPQPAPVGPPPSDEMEAAPVPATSRSHPCRGGQISADDSAKSSPMFASRLDLSQFTNIGFHPSFDQAIATPAQHAAGVVSHPGHAVTADITDRPDRFAHFRLMLSQDRIELYQRIRPVSAALRGGQHATK